MGLNLTEAKKVKGKLDKGSELTFAMVGDVFGQPFWELLVTSLMDSQDAARAIQGAIARLRGNKVDAGWEDDDE